MWKFWGKLLWGTGEAFICWEEFHKANFYTFLNPTYFLRSTILRYYAYLYIKRYLYT